MADRFTKSLERMKRLAPQATQRQRLLFCAKLGALQAEALQLGFTDHGKGNSQRCDPCSGVGDGRGLNEGGELRSADDTLKEAYAL